MRIERQFQGIVLELLHEILKANPILPFEPLPLQEEERSDILLRHRETLKPLSLIELKDPEAGDGRTPYNKDAVWKANDYASHTGCRCFVTWNILEAVVWDRTEAARPILESDIQSFSVLTRLEVEFFRTTRSLSETMRGKVDIFLTELLAFIKAVEERRPPPIRPLDERFISRLTAVIDGYLYGISKDILDSYNVNKDLRTRVIEWVVKEQFWTWEGTPASLPSEIERLTRLALLFMINKLIFYTAMQASGVWPILPKLAFPERITTPLEAKEYLWQDYFSIVVKRIDYETIFGEQLELLDELPFLSNNVVSFLEDFISQISVYDFSTLQVDVVGTLFERLIREEERHKMGQYFTRPDVVDIINAFCLPTGKESILDPGAGSGTFLVRAYVRKKERQGMVHAEALEQIWGIDIAPYPVHLACLNLAIRDLRFQRNYPRICRKDFFDILPENEQTPVKIVTPDGQDFLTPLPKVDAVVGNPPYTRQEEMEDIFEGIKNKSWRLVKSHWGYEVSRRASIYAYFFYHGAAFLKERGRLGLITSESWLDVDYGNDLKRFFLEHFKILAVVGSDVERWFGEPLVNTAITIIERCPDGQERADNLVKFVTLKKPLSEILTQFSPDEFVEIVSRIHQGDETDSWRIRPISQKELEKEALDRHSAFLGANWGKYMRAPQVFFDIRDRGRQMGKLVRLHEITTAKFGIKTGANEFFYVRDATSELGDEQLSALFGVTKRELKFMGRQAIVSGDGSYHLIEKEFLRPVIISPADTDNYEAHPSKLALLVSKEIEDLATKRILDYIHYGEERGYHSGRTCTARKRWYDLGSPIHSPLAFPERFRLRFFVPKNSSRICLNKNFYGVGDNLGDDDIDTLWSVLNSTVTGLFAEVNARQPGGGGGPIDLDVWMVEALEILDIRRLTRKIRQALKQAMSDLSSGPVSSIFEEVDKPARHALDRIVLEALGFEKEDERELVLQSLYDSYIATVKTRISKAKSGKPKSTKKRTAPRTLAIQIAIEFKEANESFESTEETLYRVKRIIKERTPLRKLQDTLLPLVWEELFGQGVTLPVPTQTRLFNV